MPEKKMKSKENEQNLMNTNSIHIEICITVFCIFD